MNDRLFTFCGGDRGIWRVVGVEPVIGETLPNVPRLEILPGVAPEAPAGARWLLRGAVSYQRYTTRPELDLLLARQPPLGRPGSTRAALIPIRKTPAWWDLPHDERRAIFETRSRHIQRGLERLPAVARRLYHGRDLDEPFDFLTWFEHSPEDADRFEELVRALRDTEEWKYVDREVDVRLAREVMDPDAMGASSPSGNPAGQ